jgi:HK97 family phage prohead protease
MNIERRYARAAVEFRAATMDGSPGVIAGYAAKYNTLSQNLGGFVESIAPGAFDKSIADGLDVLARYNHDDDALLGRTISGTCRLMLDDIGLEYEIDLPDTSVGRDLAVLAARGDVYQSSFAFYTIEDEWSMTEQGFPLRTLKAVRLVDVAPVNTPAYLDTSSGLRSLAEARGLELNAVMAAAESNNLGDLLTSAPDTRSEDADPEPQVENHGSEISFRMKQLMLRRI